MTENENDYPVTLTLDEIAMTIASLEVTIEDAVIAGLTSDVAALAFVAPLENLLNKLYDVRYGKESDESEKV
jgi:hypothetical protein